jgi:hypothetical protein
MEMLLCPIISRDEIEAQQGNLLGLTFLSLFMLPQVRPAMTPRVNNNEQENSLHDVQDAVYDADPLTLILEIANLVFQPGSLGALAAGGISATTGVLLWRDAKDKQHTEIRRKLYEIDRALNDGFGAMMVLASLLDQFNYLEKPIKVGGAPIVGFKKRSTVEKNP